MRTTIELDEKLLAEAQRLTGQHEPSVLVREALKSLIERESARRARPAGDAPDADASREPPAPPDDEPPTQPKRRPVDEVLAEIWASQEARGHVPRTREEVDRELAEERASWER